MLKTIRKWWRKHTDTKPEMPSIGAQRIRNERAQMLVKTTYDAKKGFSEEWVDLLTYADKAYFAMCPKCKHRGTLYDFKWHLDNPVVPFKNDNEQSNNEGK